MTLDVQPVRFHFVAHAPLRFAPGKAANTIRGAFGLILRRVAPPEVYQWVFEPRLAGGPSGLADAPRPFVIRAAALDGLTLAEGETFHFDVILFGRAASMLPHFAAAFRELAHDGLGDDRTAVTLSSVQPRPQVILSVAPLPEAPPRLVVRFLTPTEIKSEGRIVAVPPFATLLARIRDRASTLRELYGDGPLAIDFKGLVDRAAAVSTIRVALRHESAQRTSRRTGQTHPLGGIIGEIEYEGDFRESLPFLRAGEWTGVGRQTVWGHGCLEVLELAS